jgi:Helix-turn-helix domain
MPWRQTSPMDQKTQFLADYLRDRLSVTELCTLYGVSRKTTSTWIDRSLTHGPQGLEERSRRPSTSPRPRLNTWWRRSSTHGAGIHPGARRSLCRASAHAIPAGPGQPARPAVTSSAATIRCPGGANRAIGHPGQPTSHIIAAQEV